MWKEDQAEQTFAASSSVKQSGGAEMMSMDDAIRNIQASVTGAAEGAFPSEWLFASVGSK